ncbi:MAG: type II toxin-antitoxin system prevent-host-death family antitoxin, partial [Patescibacteria group bacterium]
GEPVVVVSNGNPDVVIMDIEHYNIQTLRLRELEEELLLKKGGEALKEYRTGKSVRLSKSKTLEEVLDA